MGAKNKVIAGDYNGNIINGTFGIVKIITGWSHIEINNSTVDSYEQITEEHQKSAGSGIFKSLVGGVLFGSAGTLGGALSAKNKSIYIIAVSFKDGKKSLLEVDEKIYKSIVKSCF